MGPLWILSTGPIPHRLRFRQKLSRLQIQNALTNSLALWPVKGAQQIHSPVIIKNKEGSIPFGSPKSGQTILLGYRLSTHKNSLCRSYWLSPYRNGLYGNEWSEPKFLGMAGSVPAAAGIPGSAHSRFVPNGSGHRCETGERREKAQRSWSQDNNRFPPGRCWDRDKTGNNRIIIFHFLSSFCSHISVIKTSEAA